MKDRDIDSGTLTVDSIEEALMSYAQYVENQTRGEWDAPATLWGILFAEGREHRGEDLCVGVALQIRPIALLEGHPKEALVGKTIPDNYQGALMICEGWLRGEEYEGSREETRMVHIVLRDGTEILYQRPRNESIEEMHHFGQIGGTVGGALRRTLGLGSRTKEEDESPGLENIRERVAFTIVANAVAQVATDPDRGVFIDMLKKRGKSLVDSVCRGFGLDKDTWEEARLAALERVRESNGDVEEFLAWADGDQWAEKCDIMFAEKSHVIEMMKDLVDEGCLKTKDYLTALDILETGFL
jgi:hypothetical protein